MPDGCRQERCELESTKPLLQHGTGSALTPCAGKCSTVFGDSVCRGCRRFHEEIIQWNQLDTATQTQIWLRLDQQLDQLILRAASLEEATLLEHYIESQQLRFRNEATQGRRVFEGVRRFLRMNPLGDAVALRNATGVHALKPAHQTLGAWWDRLDQKLYALGVASYELAWLRAAQYADSAETADSAFEFGPESPTAGFNEPNSGT